MDGDADLAAVGALLAEPARARILAALGDGRALPASALAAEAGVAPSTASGHLVWSERRPHAAGKLGAALAARAFELGWVERLDGSRALRVTAAGEVGFVDAFGLPLV